MQQKNFAKQSEEMNALREALERSERECLSVRAECSALHRKLKETESKANAELERRKDERRQHEKEMKRTVTAISVVALLICATTCAISAPWWTAVAPALFAFTVLLRAGQ